MDINQAFPSNYVKASDVTRPVVLKMLDVKIEILGEGDGAEEKPVLYFAGAKKGLVLNKTNSGRIADLYGPETDNWLGKPIELRAEKTEMQGRRVDCIRVHPPTARPAPGVQPGAAAAPAPHPEPPPTPRPAPPDQVYEYAEPGSPPPPDDSYGEEGEGNAPF